MMRRQWESIQHSCYDAALFKKKQHQLKIITLVSPENNQKVSCVLSGTEVFSFT